MRTRGAGQSVAPRGRLLSESAVVVANPDEAAPVRRGGAPRLAVDDGREASTDPDDFAPAARGFNPDLVHARHDRGCGWTGVSITYLVVFVKRPIWTCLAAAVGSSSRRSQVGYAVCQRIRYDIADYVQNDEKPPSTIDRFPAPARLRGRHSAWAWTCLKKWEVIATAQLGPRADCTATKADVPLPKRHCRV